MIAPIKKQKLDERLYDLGLKDSDLDEQFILSSGKGGQAQNKRASSVDLKHLPTGIRVKVQKHRSQELNRYYAKVRLCDLYEERILGIKSKQSLAKEKKVKQKKRRKRRTLKKLDSDA